MRLILAILLALLSDIASAETVRVRYHGPVSLESFARSDVNAPTRVGCVVGSGITLACGRYEPMALVRSQRRLLIALGA